MGEIVYAATVDPIENVTLIARNITSNVSNEGVSHNAWDSTPEFAKVIRDIIIPIICTCGIIGIILTVIVLSRKNMSTSTNCYLMGLAFADLFFLIIFGTRMCESLFPSREGKVYYLFLVYLTYATVFMNIFLLMSIWITVMLAVERYIAICRPFMAVKMCTVGKARLIIVLIFLACVVCRLPNFFEHKLKYIGDLVYPDKSQMALDPRYYGVYPWVVDVAIMSVIPFVLLLILNIRLIWEVRKSTAYIQQNLMVVHGPNNAHTVHKEELQITVMLISVIMVFFICQAPYVIFVAIASLNAFQNAHSGMLIFRNVAILLLTIKSAVNFILYCWFSEKFWTTLKRIFCVEQCVRHYLSRKPGCNCLRGKCANTIDSSGSCVTGSCLSGYTGDNCDFQTVPCTKNGLSCHAHAECVMKKRDRVVYGIGNGFSRRKLKRRRKNRAYCRCKQGYAAVGLYCQEINPCVEESHLCHPEASCVHTGPGQSECRCDEGWVGDGYYCYASTPCKDYQACHDNATCIEQSPGKAVCQCKDDYHGNGTYCVLNDMCKDQNGGCNQNAICVSIGPGQVNCTCVPPLNGDGYNCYGTIIFEVEGRPELQEFLSLLQKIPLEDDFLSDIRGDFTLFAPNNSAVIKFLSDTDSAWTREENLLTLIRFHTVDTILTLSDLDNITGQSLSPLAKPFQLNVSGDSEEILINKAVILDGNIVALNGLIHIVDLVLEPFPPPKIIPSLKSALEENPEFSIFFFYLKKTGVLKTLQSFPQYTVLAPLNEAWRKFKQTRISAQFISYFIIKDLKLTRKDLINNADKLLPTLLDKSLAIHSDGMKLAIDGDEVNVKVFDLEINAGYIQGIDGLLNPLLNFCGTQQNKPTTTCCPGYYSSQCKECAGGPVTPCSNNGKCNDSINGDGTCVCDQGYAGTACQYCAQNSKCHLEDPCSLNNGGCDPFAKCEPIKDGIKCSCILGYIGDGTYCQSPCEIENGGCHQNATCQLWKEDIMCRCQTDFVGNGKQCDHILGACSIGNGGCSSQATCLPVKDTGDVICSCMIGYVGDGVTCNGDLWDTLQQLAVGKPALQQFIQVLEKSAMENMLHSKARNLTVFAPAYGNMSSVDPQNYIVEGYMVLNNSVSSMLHFKSLNNKLIVVTEDYNDSDTDELEFQVNGFLIVKKNIIATNGVIHIVDHLVFSENPEGKSIQPFSNKNHVALAVGVTVGIVFCAMLICIVLWKQKGLLCSRCTQLRDRTGTFMFQKLEDADQPEVSFHSSTFDQSSFNDGSDMPTEKQ